MYGPPRDWNFMVERLRLENGRRNGHFSLLILVQFSRRFILLVCARESQLESRRFAASDRISAYHYEYIFLPQCAMPGLILNPGEV